MRAIKNVEGSSMIFLIDWLQKKAEGTKRELLTAPKAEDLVIKPEIKKEPPHPKRRVRYWNV